MPGGFLLVRPLDNRPEFAVPVDETGVAEFRVPKGRYGLHVVSPGRPPTAERVLEMSAGSSAVWPVPLEKPASARLAVRGRIDGIVAPLAGRVTAFGVSGAAASGRVRPTRCSLRWAAS